ncbi:hypothetical protein D3C71_1506280 [compost metagenome]
MQLPNPLARLPGGGQGKSLGFTVFGTPGSGGRSARFKQLAGGALRSTEDGLPVAKELHVGLLQAGNGKLDQRRVVLLLFFPECNILEHAHRRRQAKLIPHNVQPSPFYCFPYSV